MLILPSENVTSIRMSGGGDVVINHLFGRRIETLVQEGFVDALIVDSEDGFSQLGDMRKFLSEELGLPERNLIKHVMDGFPEDFDLNISSLADWNRRNTDVTLVAIPSKRSDSKLKGIVMAPYEGSKCYKQFAFPEYSRPYRDFFYNVSYEAISYVFNKWGAKNIGLTHLARMRIHEDVTTCQIEAICHFCDDHTGIESFTFTDIFDGNVPIKIAKEFNGKNDRGQHRAIATELHSKLGCEFITINFPRAVC